MFTGLIRTQGEIRRVDQRGDRIFAIAMAEPFAVEIGDSIACNGICLTAIKLAGHEFKVSVSEETLRCSNAGDWKVGTRLNLEPSLKIGDSLGGHFVSGHVDGLARAAAQAPEGDSVRWDFEVPPGLAKFIAPKGSVTLDGVSLTVNQVTMNRFSVNIIPHTQKETGFSQLQVGERVNLEVDLLARYVARLTEKTA
ncbi:MAG: riboflavin synthase [Rickettsiales bacterium]